MLYTLLNIQAQPIDSIKQPAAIIDNTIKTIISTPLDELIHQGIKISIEFGVKVLAAITIYLIGAWLIKRVKTLINRVMVRKNADPSLRSFILSFTKITLTVILIITTINVLGVDTTSIVALIAGSGLAIGMALSGTLQNFAGGIMILLFKPFKVGDYIEAQGFNGTVHSIEITTTHIYTPDNKMIILPNGSLSNGTINNYSATGTRRCEWKIGISYGNNVEDAKNEILKIINESPLIITEPAAPMAALASLDDSAVVIVARAWAKSEDYWTLFYSVNEQIYNKLPKAGISFPFPQMDVHIVKD